jgi:hypothetical protein
MLTPKFRVNFPNLDTPKKTERGTDQYSVSMLIPKNLTGEELELFNAMRKEIFNCMCAKFGADQTKWPTNYKNPFKDGDAPERAKYPEMAGHWVVEARTNFKPAMVDEKVMLIITPGKFYSGCYAIADVSAYAYDNPMNKGAAFGLGCIQFAGDGEKLAGAAPDPKAVFSPLVSQTSGNQTTFADDDIPF